MKTLSVLLITLNEAHNLGRCLRSLQGVADEVIVMDSGSTDGTQSLALAMGARVMEQPWLGYGPQKNFAQNLATGDYILSIDADEELTPELRHSILAAKEKGLAGAYAMNRLNFFYGKPAMHGLEYPDWKVRIYPREGSRWSSLAVHEDLILPEGIQVQRLAGHLNHFTYRTFQEHLDKTIRYGHLAADEMRAKIRAGGRRVPASKLILSPVSIFFKSFVLKGGFKGGSHGLMLAMMSAFGKFVKYAMAREGLNQDSQD